MDIQAMIEGQGNKAFNMGDSVKNSAIKLLLSQSLQSLIISTIAVFLCFGLVKNAAPELDVQLWFYVALAVATARFTFWAMVRNKKPDTGMLNGYTFFCFLSGASWGLLGWHWSPELPILAQLIIIIFPMAMSVGAVSAYGSFVKTFLLFAVPAQVPLMWLFITSGSSLIVQLSLPTALFFVAQLVLVKSYNKQIIESIRLKITNQNLIENLSMHNAELEIARDEAQSASVAKTEFLARMSHEIRTPMHAVLGMTDLLVKTKLDAHQKGVVKTLRGSGEALLTLINDLLDVSKIEAGGLQLEQANYNLKGVIDGLVSRHKVLSDKKSIDFDYTIANEVPEWLLGDSHRLEQVLSNLTGNAIKFTEVGNVLLDIRVRNLDEQHWLCLEVSDTGAGIEQDRIDAIFDVFQQADGSVTRRYGGTGLGLSIARDIISLMDGEISVSSVVGQGSTFSVRVPLLEGEAPNENTNAQKVLPSSEHSKQSKSYTSNKETAMRAQVSENAQPDTKPAGDESASTALQILIAEDNPVNQMLLEAMLEDVNCEVCVADNGQEAIDELQSKHFDLIFMDCQMPVLDGFNATKLARELGYDLPIIAVTANAMKGDRAACLAAGMSDYVAKPFDSDTIISMLEKWSGLKHEPQAA